ncbi:Hypp9271 [Branchiostoma lanceolatum]|uniref:Hypp9271 protein n=1 Tax=Branchiostoma lanceolatum TaxID=7740 RepID=A0A8J9ZEU4_BRALA|nr:Hypp9271 [Branchiostoma lanceolatum]
MSDPSGYVAISCSALSLIRRSTTAARLQVNLESNQIGTVLEEDWKTISDTGVILRLKGNPLVCDGGMRWLVCNAMTWQLTRRGNSDIVRPGALQCTSPSKLAGSDFKSLYTNSFCTSTELTTRPPIATTLSFAMATTSASPIAMTSAFLTTEPTTLPSESFGTTISALTQRARIKTLGATDSTRCVVLEKDLDDGQQAGMGHLYIPVGLTVAGLVLLGGTAVAVMIYKRRVSRRR